MGEFYAHTPGKNGKWHMLVPHLERTAEAARSNAEKFDAGELAWLAGMWHDIGKFNPEFQEYLRLCHEAAQNGGPAPRKGVPHAVYGAMLAARHLEALAPPLYGHHSGLRRPATVKDGIADPGNRKTWEQIEPSARRRLGALEPEESAGRLLAGAPDEPLGIEFFVRMLFSALADADFLDTERHFDSDSAGLRGASVTPGELRERLRRDQEAMISAAEDTPVNLVRREVYESCLEAARREQGVFRLSVPTGGGKTRSGLAFALEHAVEHGLDRVIVAAPYTSIIEQTAASYRGIFSGLGDAVLEHHSAVASEAGDDDAEEATERRARSRLAAQNWDAPLVVTTMVQLFESLFANRTSRCRKLHNLCRSVIVLDEVQTLPARLLTPAVAALRELTRRYRVTVVLCTATQPALEQESRYLEGFEPGSVRDIVPRERAQEHFGVLRRVDYERPRQPLSRDEVARGVRAASPEGQAMVVLNTRRDALETLEAVGEESALHLSTLLCGAHRREVLEEVRRRLQSGEPCLLAATQVVEAGVDLDFPAVFRAVGPLDRIVQAAGRCNREGRLGRMGRVVVFEPEEGGAPRGEYAAAIAEARRILSREDADLHDPGIFREYFSRLYQDVDTDAEGIQDLRRRLDYPEVADRFRLIRDATVPVVVRYEGRGAEEVEALISRIRRERMLRPGDHRRLQPYVVNLRKTEVEENGWLVEEIAEGVYVWSGEYDQVRGISVSRDPADLIF